MYIYIYTYIKQYYYYQLKGLRIRLLTDVILLQ